VLGNGYIEWAKPTFTARLCIEQSYPHKENYILSLFNLFKPLVTNEPRIITRKADKRTRKIYKSIAFKTLAIMCLNKYRDLFYKDKIKIVPQNIHELITARSLAYWIMDDKSKTFYNQMILHTRAFTKEEVILLQKALEIKFKLITHFEEKGYNQWVIIIPLKQKNSFKRYCITIYA